MMNADMGNNPIVNTETVKIETRCTYSEYRCKLSCINKYRFCIQHILEDKSAPYRQCKFVYRKTDRSCFRAAPVTDVYGYCPEHSAQMVVKTQKQSSSKSKENAEALINELSHHRKLPASSLHTVPDHPSASKAFAFDDDDNDENIDVTAVDVMQLPRMDDDSDFDMEGDYDCLDHAEVYTSEEVVKIYTEKLKKLKESYVEEFKNLSRELKINRNEYLKASKHEKDTLTNTQKSSKSSVQQQDAYREVNSYAKYQKCHGVEAILKNQQSLLQSGIESVTAKSPLGSNILKCIHAEGSYKCGDKTVPMSKYCFKHILNDNHQVLFKMCSSVNNDEVCQTPVAQIPNSPTCVFHMTLPDLNLSSLDIQKGRRDGSSGGNVLDLSNSSGFMVSQLPTAHVMEGDATLLN